MIPFPFQAAGFGMIAALPELGVFVNDYVTPFAVWSAEKKLVRGYFGPLIRVRRSSDSAELDIGYDPATGLLDTVALLAHTGADSGYVTKIYKQAGATAADLLQAGPSNQPRIVDAGVVETDFVMYDGADDHMTAALTGSGINNASATVFTKIRINSTNSNGQYGGSIDLGYNFSTNRGFAIYSEDRVLTGTPGVVFAMSGSGSGPYMQRSFMDTDRASRDGTHIFSVRYNTTGSTTGDLALRAYMDGSDAMQSTPSAGDPTGTFNATALYIGCFQYSSEFNQCGLHSLVLVAGDALSSRASIEALL